MPSEVITIGTATVDHLSIVNKTPEGWEQCAAPFIQGGGPAATGATAIARLGGSVEVWSVVGDDYHGRMIRDELWRDGVDISQVKVAKGYRSLCSFIEVDAETGDRTIYTSGLANLPTDYSSYFDPSRARMARALMVMRFAPEIALEAARLVRANGGVVVADLHNVDGPVSELVHHVDALIVPEVSIETLAGSYDVPRALRVLADLGSTMPAVTVGPRGCYYICDGQIWHCPAFPVKAVDTTGCGDSFHGAYCYAMARGMHQHEAIRLSSAVSALKATKPGGRSGLPTLEEVCEFMERRGDQARARRLGGSPV